MFHKLLLQKRNDLIDCVLDLEWHKRVVPRMWTVLARPHLHIYLHVPVDILTDKIKKRQSEDVSMF